MTFAKHVPHAGTSFCLSHNICLWNWNKCHRTAITSFSYSSVLLHLPIYLIASLVVENMGVSISMDKSELNWFFGAERYTLWPSSTRRKSFHLTRSLVHRKSFKKITSPFSTPTQPYLSLAGLEKVQKMSSSGLSKNVFPQFAGPVIIMFWYFPLPLMGKLRMGSANTKGWIPFLSSSWVAHWNHSPRHMYSFSEASSKISILLIWALFMVDVAVSIRFSCIEKIRDRFLWPWQQLIGKVFLAIVFLGTCNEKELICTLDIVASNKFINFIITQTFKSWETSFAFSFCTIA